MINTSAVFILFLSGWLRLASSVVNYTLPDGFKIGVATSAYQIEGAWDEDGKGPSMWDTVAHNDSIIMLDTGDVACDSYHKLADDIQMLKYLNVSHYRFSISWTRVLPYGDLSNINEKGIAYYQRLIGELKKNNIEPMITLYHWDLPQELSDLGGWLNPDMEYFFADYATQMFSIFGADVKYWLTFNEPSHICETGYGSGDGPPMIHSKGIGNYQCAHIVLKSHARVYHIYQEQFKELYGGRLSIVLDNHWQEPASDKPEDIEAAERSMQFWVGWFANPIYHSNGNYPQVMIDRIEARSIAEGFNVSRLPVFTQEEIEYIKGTADFFAINSYSTSLVEWIPDEPISTPSLLNDISVLTRNDPSWKVQATGWAIVPWGLRNLLNWIHKTYNGPEIFITENGYADFSGKLDDDTRVNYYREHISNVLLAIYEDNINIIGYTAWSLMDNLEWVYGFLFKFGLFHVDMKDEFRARTPKKSAKFFKSMIASRCLTDGCKMHLNLSQN